MPSELQEGTIYSNLEIALSILAASLTPLRPLLMKISGFGDGPSQPALGSLITFGQAVTAKVLVIGLMIDIYLSSTAKRTFYPRGHYYLKVFEA
jgi:hypothetical protein